MRIPHPLTLSLVLAFFSLAGCTSSGSADSWAEIDRDALDAGGTAQLTRAEAARDELFGALMSRLLGAIAEGGTPTAIEVCQVAAPEIAEEAGNANDVTIGRTSFRLRNPENTPPDWAVPYVEARRAEPVVLRDEDDGTLAALFPIHLKAACVQCHGPTEQIQPAVREALKEAYPEDEATGFAEGDLRGWFHVTVPAAS